MTSGDGIIIGGGHNGLVAAAYLAHAGLKPLLLERRAVAPCRVPSPARRATRTATRRETTMMTAPMVSPTWLQDRLANPTVRLLEICSTPDTARYREGHIPGALGVYWKDLCWHETDRELISPAGLARRFSAMGIRPTDTLVLYGDPVQYGTYAFWTLTMAGHPDLRLLDGARTKWTQEGRPLRATSREGSPRSTLHSVEMSPCDSAATPSEPVWGERADCCSTSGPLRSTAVNG